MSQTQTPDAARLLVECLVAQGCDRIFTVPGESFLQVLDGLHGQTDIDVITCRQEGGVSFMACADGAMTGRPGVGFVTRGPGATNATIGVHVAFQDSQPMVLFVGDVARDMKDREGFQEIDFPAFFGPIAKWAARIDNADRIPEYVARAARLVGGVWRRLRQRACLPAAPAPPGRDGRWSPPGRRAPGIPECGRRGRSG
jgi:acetolactate synthase I/II/III large subunit